MTDNTALDVLLSDLRNLEAKLDSAAELGAMIDAHATSEEVRLIADTYENAVVLLERPVPPDPLADETMSWAEKFYRVQHRGVSEAFEAMKKHFPGVPIDRFRATSDDALGTNFHIDLSSPDRPFPTAPADRAAGAAKKPYDFPREQPFAATAHGLLGGFDDSPARAPREVSAMDMHVGDEALAHTARTTYDSLAEPTWAALVDVSEGHIDRVHGPVLLKLRSLGLVGRAAALTPLGDAVLALGPEEGDDDE